MSELSPWLRKYLAVAALVGSVALAWGALLRPLIGWAMSAIEATRDAQFELERARSTLARSRVISAELIQQGEREINERLVAAATEAEAVTQVQSLLDRLVRESGAVLGSIQAVPAKPRGPLVGIGVELKASGPEQTIAAFLASVEQSVPWLQVERLTLQAGEGVAGGGAAAVAVHMEVVVVGLWSPRSGRSAR